MAIVPTHFVWQRERSEHHSGAQRQYSETDHTRIPRGPLASPVSCALCKRDSRLDQGSSSFAPFRGSSEQTPNHVFPQPFTSPLSLEVTPPRAAASRQKSVETRIKAQHTSCCCPEEVRGRYHLHRRLIFSHSVKSGHINTVIW